jgi:hypothetical protein
MSTIYLKIQRTKFCWRNGAQGSQPAQKKHDPLVAKSEPVVAASLFPVFSLLL